MSPAAILRMAAAEGVTLTLSSTGNITAIGAGEAVNRWLPILRKNKPGIVVALATNPTLFDFAPPSDPDSDREAIEERAGIIAEGSGMAPTQALQEARWQVERERAWRGFLGNAKRILDAPERERTALLDRYRAEAAERYGEATAETMAGTMRGWIITRASDGEE